MNLEDLSIKEAPGRFYIGALPDEVLAYADYRISGAVLTVLYVETSPLLRGQGIAAQLVAYAVDYTRRNGLKIDALCSYAASQLMQHAEYSDMLA